MRKYAGLSVCIALFGTAIEAHGQIDSMMAVYREQAAPEKIHIHFDKNVYNRGETIWYKVYVLQGRDSMAASVNVYLDWYDANGTPLSHTASPILLSAASGSFDIPSNYKGPSIQVKAYTRWMLNDHASFIFQKELAVNTGFERNARAPGSTSVAVFPEGGFLVQGLRNRVAFKATDPYGSPVYVKGVLTDDQNNILDSLAIQHDGMGIFYLEPAAEQHYELRWTDEFGATGSTKIPAAKTQGAQIGVTRLQNKVMFQVTRTEPIPDPFKKMSMLVHMNQVGLFKVDIDLSSNTTLTSSIPVDGLPSGLLQFTLFTSDWVPVAERVIFINNHAHTLPVQLSAPLVNLEKRGKNSLEIFIPDTSFANMSLAVTDAELNPPDKHTIVTNLLLTSEVKGKIHNPAYYFSSRADSVAAHLDLVMLTNGWRRFDWERIKANLAPKIEHPVDTGYMQMNGILSGLKKNNTGLELNLLVVHNDSSRQFISIPVKSNGRFEYPMVFFDTAHVFYSINRNKSLSEKAELKLENGLLDRPLKKTGTGSVVSGAGDHLLAIQKLDRLLREQDLLNKLRAETTLQDVTVNTRKKTREEILNEKYASGLFQSSPSKKEYVYDLTDPSKPTIAMNILEYLQGKIPGLNIIYNGSLSYRIDWRGYLPEFFLNENKIDLATLMDVPVAGIAMIKAFGPPFMFATGGGRGGAVAVYTKKGRDTELPDPKGLASVLLPGYSKFREFYSPDYSQASDEPQKTDNRTTIYWNPFVFSNKSQQRIRLDFYNNDFTKTFNVVLEGINADGKLIRVVKTISGVGIRNVTEK